MDGASEAHLYRIAQEAVNNAIAHGRGSRIEISLRIRDGQGTIRIRDNGVGIAREPIAVAGVGLRTMEHRARLIGCSIRVRRASPRGTIIACAFAAPPVPAKERSRVRKPA